MCQEAEAANSINKRPVDEVGSLSLTWSVFQKQFQKRAKLPATHLCKYFPLCTKSRVAGNKSIHRFKHKIYMKKDNLRLFVSLKKHIYKYIYILLYVCVQCVCTILILYAQSTRQLLESEIKM